MQHQRILFEFPNVLLEFPNLSTPMPLPTHIAGQHVLCTYPCSLKGPHVQCLNLMFSPQNQGTVFVESWPRFIVVKNNLFNVLKIRSSQNTPTWRCWCTVDCWCYTVDATDGNNPVWLFSSFLFDFTMRSASTYIICFGSPCIKYIVGLDQIHQDYVHSFLWRDWVSGGTYFSAYFLSLVVVTFSYMVIISTETPGHCGPRPLVRW